MSTGERVASRWWGFVATFVALYLGVLGANLIVQLILHHTASTVWFLGVSAASAAVALAVLASFEVLSWIKRVFEARGITLTHPRATGRSEVVA